MARRALVLVAMFGAVVVANGAAQALVLARGVAFLLGPWGGPLQLPFAVALGLAAGAILGGIGRRPAAAAWFRPARRSVVDLIGGAALGVVAVGIIAALARLTAQAAPGGTLAGAPFALLSFTVNAALQQAALAGLALAASRPDRAPGPGGALFALAFFTAIHAQESTAPLYLLNVALFGLATLGFSVARGGIALAVGLHGAWNAALFLVGGVTLPGAAGALSWTTREALWSGGAAGFEHGLANGVVVAAVAVGAWVWVWRRG